MTIIGDGEVYESFMVQWMKEHPGNWRRCPKCRNWLLASSSASTSEHCPLCPPKRKKTND